MTDVNPPSNPSLRSRSEPFTLHRKAHGIDAEKTARELSIIQAQYRQAEIEHGHSLGFFCGCVTLVFVLCGFTSSTSTELFFLFAFLGGIGTLASYTWTPVRDKKYWIAEADYYRLSGSRRLNGTHNCVFCSACGIWRKGEYGSNAVYARCSTCRAELFYE